MDIDERIAALTMNLELMSRDREDDKQKLLEQGRQTQAHGKQIEAQGKQIEAQGKQIQDLYLIARQDGENIRALARIAEIHERRLTGIEGTEP